MLWIYIIIGLVVVIGLLYWIKSRKKGGIFNLFLPYSMPPTPLKDTETWDLDKTCPRY